MENTVKSNKNKKRFSQAIVRMPCKNMVKGITSSDLGEPDYEEALKQHGHYVEALKACGLEVTVLPADERYPDSTFVEDAALMTPHCAIVTNPGAESRKGETGIIREPVLSFYDAVEIIDAPGTVDAGDIMMVGDHYYIGLSERTNKAGAVQMIELLQKYGMNGTMIHLKGLLHLKTGLSYLENNRLLTIAHFFDAPEFSSFDKLKVIDREAYAANSVWINGKVLTPDGFPETRVLIENAGYETICVDTSEFRKLDGGLSCLSLRF